MRFYAKQLPGPPEEAFQRDPDNRPAGLLLSGPGFYGGTVKGWCRIEVLLYGQIILPAGNQCSTVTLGCRAGRGGGSDPALAMAIQRKITV